MKRKLLALLVCAALPIPALAQPHVIAELGTAPLIGQVASTQQLQSDVRAQRAVFEAAGRDLGLTSAEFAQFEQRIERRDLTYVVIPRHLDAMSWRSGGRVHVLHDVIVPAGTHGWEVDLREGSQILALFIPNRCGNLSLLRRPAPRLARAPQVKALSQAPLPAPPPVALSTQAPLAPPTPVPAAPTPAPYASLAMSTSPAPAPPAHHFRAWPLLLIPIVALFASHHGGTGPVVSGPLPASGPPAVVGCPTPKP